MNTELIIAMIFGLIIGAWLMVAGIYIYKIYDENRYKKRLTIEKLLREIEVRNTLNQKVIEILNRPITGSDKELINPQSDVKVPFYDYNFLKNYTSMYNLYIPTYFLNTFFKKLSHHLAVFDDEQDLKNGVTFSKSLVQFSRIFLSKLLMILRQKNESYKRLKMFIHQC